MDSIEIIELLDRLEDGGYSFRVHQNQLLGSTRDIDQDLRASIQVNKQDFIFQIKHEQTSKAACYRFGCYSCCFYKRIYRYDFCSFDECRSVNIEYLKRCMKEE